MAAPSYDLGRCCNYEMAVWEREGEDKAIWKKIEKGRRGINLEGG